MIVADYSFEGRRRSKQTNSEAKGLMIRMHNKRILVGRSKDATFLKFKTYIGNKQIMITDVCLSHEAASALTSLLMETGPVKYSYAVDQQAK